MTIDDQNPSPNQEEESSTNTNNNDVSVNDKSTLEIKKLKLEVAALEQSTELDQKKFRLENRKFWFGLLPIFITLITISVQVFFLLQEKKRKDRAEAMKWLDNMAQSYDGITDIDDKLSLAKALCKYDSIPVSEKRRAYFCDEVKRLSAKVDSTKMLAAEADSISIINRSKVSEKYIREINDKELTILINEELLKSDSVKSNPEIYNKLQQEINNLTTQTDSLIQANKILAITKAELDTIDTQQSQIALRPTPTQKSNIKLIVDKYSWLKNGSKKKYFRMFDGDKIVLKDLLRKSQTVFFDLQIRSKQKFESKEFKLRVGEKKEIKLGNFLYEITFLRIGHAGNNPFTKAAYFIYRKYQII